MKTDTPKRWHWEDIKASLRKKGYPLKRVAHEKGYSPKSNITTLKTTTWPDLEKTVADIIGMQPMGLPWVMASGGKGVLSCKKGGASAVPAPVSLPRFCAAFFYQTINPTTKTQPQPKATK